VNTVTVGTGEHCDIVVTDDYASTHHCRIMQTARGWMLADGGSTNGTWVVRDGERHRVSLGEIWTLRPGDVIVVGRTELPPWTG
jgi:pSer/pThr/pTyr-binding forkhead associated (FHA) protein